jgi:hypothetical protein
MKNRINTNVIEEIYKGHYQVILDFPTANDLGRIISSTHKYIWGVEHNEGRTAWSKYEGLLYGVKSKGEIVFARNIKMEFLIEVKDFLSLIPHIHQTVKIIQTNDIPPSYINIESLKGKSKYDLLKEKVDYLFEIDIPGSADYAPIVSPSVDYLNNVIKQFKV